MCKHVERVYMYKSPFFTPKKYQIFTLFYLVYTRMAYNEYLKPHFSLYYAYSSECSKFACFRRF